MTDLDRNKQVVVDYYQAALSGDPEKAVSDHVGSRYIQHNPDAADGPEAFIGFVRWLRGEYPNLRLDIKRVIAEGDMVVTHSHLDLEPGNPDNPVRARGLLPPGRRQGRRALGCHPGRAEPRRQPQRHVLTGSYHIGPCDRRGTGRRTAQPAGRACGR
jgi:predicted SnoaL-like aldol condensation-catalyzing enzyme